MEVSFNQFRFDCQQQILTKNGEVIPLTDKAVKLLTLLIENPKVIHTKSDILDAIWRERVVSDQVIFQNISQLRNILGNEAIKTYSKKGYQWQLPLSTVSAAKVPTQHIEQVTEKSNDAKLNQGNDKRNNTDNPTSSAKAENPEQTTSLNVKKVMLPLSFISLVVTLTLFVFWNISKSAQPMPTPSQVHVVHTEDQKLMSIDAINHVSSEELFNSPYETWQAERLEQSHWLVNKLTYTLDDGYALRFLIQGAERGWEDYIYADTVVEAEKNLETLLTKLAETDFFTVKSEHAATSALTLLFNKYNKDEFINRALTKQYLQVNQIDKALLHANSLNSPNELSRGLALQLKSKVLAEQHNFDLSKSAIEQALLIFSELGLPHLEADALVIKSWYYMGKEEFITGIKVLNKALNKARTSKQKLLELNILLSQAMMAYKNQQNEMAYSLIDLAKQIIMLHDLNPVHYVPINAMEARFSDAQDDKLKYYLSTIDGPYTPMYERYYYSAVNNARDIFIERLNWQAASELSKKWQRPSYLTLSKAQIAAVQNSLEQATALAKQAFEQANMYNHKIDALNSALFLILHVKDEQKPLVSASRLFITKESTARWKMENRAKLVKLDL